MKQEILLSESILSDIVELAPKMRQEHKDEVWRSNRHTPEQALINAYMQSERKYTVRIYDRVAFMFGVIPQGEGEGIIWALGSCLVDQIPKEFCETAIVMMDFLLNDYNCLWNYVDDEYKTGLKFAKFLGANIYEPMNFGEEGEPFRLVEFIRTEV